MSGPVAKSKFALRDFQESHVLKGSKDWTKRHIMVASLQIQGKIVITGL